MEPGVINVTNVKGLRVYPHQAKAKEKATKGLIAAGPIGAKAKEKVKSLGRVVWIQTR